MHIPVRTIQVGELTGQGPHVTFLVITLWIGERAVLNENREVLYVKGDDVRWISVAGLSLAMLASGNMESGGHAAGAALAAEPAQVPARSLSPEEIGGLREGEGMGLARAAEHNGYPGPTHVLEAARAGKVDLYAEQRQAIERILEAMTAKAQELGQQILAQEALLEAGFRRDGLPRQIWPGRSRRSDGSGRTSA
jgi:hypothetical protein